MALYEAQPGKASSQKFTATMRAVDLTLLRLIGAGVVSGLLISGAGVVSAGEALIGHVVALAAPVNALPLCAHSATNYVYLAMPPAPACVGLDGKDAGLLQVNQSSVAPDSAVLLGVIVTNAAGAVVSVDTAPAGRRDLAVPFSAGGGGGSGTGAAGTITVRNVFTGDPDTEVEIVNVGTDSAAVLDITIPRGEPGVQGDPGRQGMAALTPRGAYDPAVAYAAGDFVYDGSAVSTGSFIALQASTGAALVDGANWRLAQPPGQAGPAGPAFFKPRGPYDASVTYAVGDVVSANRAVYAAVQASTGQPVSNAAYWQLLQDAAPAGQAATITGFEVHTLPAGSSPTVTNTGTETEAYLVFGFPTAPTPPGTGPATAMALGTVKTDITESGGSVVYTKTTADSTFTTQAALTASKGAANGLASLDSSGKVPLSQLPATDAPSSVTSVAGRAGVVTLTAPDIGGLGTAATANLPAAGANASAAQVVRGDDTRLGTSPGTSLVVQELTSGKSFSGITTLQFPDGTLSLISAGVVKYTPASGGAGGGGGKNKANGTTYAAGIARWLCNDPTTGTALVDSISAPGNNLTASAAGLFGSDTIGEYFSPGGTDYANGAGNAGLLTGQGDFSYEHYIQSGSSVSDTTFYGSQSDITGNNAGIIFEAGISNSQFLGYLGTASGSGTYYKFGTPQTNSLYHIVVVYSSANTSATVYVNGASIGTQNIGGARAVPGNNTLNRLGDRSAPTGTSTYRWKGKIYFGAIYARAMPAAEVQARYTAIG